MIKGLRDASIVHSQISQLMRLSKDTARLFKGKSSFESLAINVQRCIDRDLAERHAALLDYEDAFNRKNLPDLTYIASTGKDLVRARISAGWNQSDLAERVGLKQQQINRYEERLYEQASLETIQKIGKVLQEQLDDLNDFFESDEWKAAARDSKY